MVDPMTKLAVDLDRMKGDVAAINALVTLLITGQIERSSETRTEFEQLLGTARAFRSLNPTSKGDDEALVLMGLSGIDRRLTEISAALSVPLVPRASMGKVPETPPGSRS